MKISHKSNYTVFEWKKEADTFHLHELLSLYPSIVEGKYVVVTSWDSGVFKPTKQELALGWKVNGKLAHSPCVNEWSSLPTEQYDEWYIFEQPISICELEAMVNYQCFSPLDFEWNEKKELFWEQIEKYKPMHIVGEGCYLFFVTRDEELSDKISNQAYDRITGT